MKTHEQDVVAARTAIEALKQQYIQEVQKFLAEKEQSLAEKELLLRLGRVHQAANKYFNFVETFVGDSDLLGAHRNAKWVTGFAEDCAAHLGSLLLHHRLMSGAAGTLGYPYPTDVPPDPTAFANMQRMVTTYAPDRAATLKEEFAAAGLPTRGFDSPAFSEQLMSEKRRQNLLLFGGTALLAITVVLSFIAPSPTPTQEIVQRALLAIGLASVGTHIPGFLNVSAKIKNAWLDFAVVAGGALAIFVLVWLVNPPLFSVAQQQ